MRKVAPAQMLSLLLAFFFAALSPCAAQSQSSADEQSLWKLERSYWDYVQANDLTSYRALWHKDFIGWPAVSAAPVNKEHITDWITSQTSQGRTFKTVEFKPASLHVNGDVAVTYYRVTYKWMNRDGDAATITIRVTHTLLRDGKDWHIIGGMSMPENESPQR
jgi:ketosteroid isomerase-like protein